MTKSLHQVWRRIRWAAMLPALLLSLALPAAAQIDAGINKNVWKILYGATSAQVNSSAWLAADDDGDGMSNEEELNSGTNPFMPNSVLKVVTITSTPTTLSMTFPTAINKLYLAQVTTALAPPSWLNVAPAVQVAGDGTDKTLVVPKSAGAFFRVLVQDLDLDGDGVSDWAEQNLGLSTASVASSGQVDFNGLLIPDLAFANSQLGAQGAVVISAVNSSATQPAAVGQSATEIGKFKITRSGFSQFLPALTVNLAITGTATADTDYVALPVNVDFLENETSKEILVTPLHNAALKTGASVVATLTASPNYTIGGQGWAAVIVHPTTAPSGTGLLGRYYDTSSFTYAHASNFGQDGTYTYTRVGTTPYTNSTIVIPYTYSGSPALQVGHLVRVNFTSGNLNSGTYNNVIYPVTAVSAGVNFTLGISGAGLPANSSGNCNFSVQSIPHLAVIERVDAMVNFDWMGGTPNGAFITPANSPDNYSTYWEGYLHPTAAGDYQFQLDADDQARVLLDLDNNGSFDLPGEQIVEHGWDTGATVGTFKQSAAYTLAVPASPAQRLKIRVEHVETTGDARCRLQWRAGTAGFANIPQANVFSHTPAMSANYNYTRVNSSPYTGSTIVVTLNNHGLAVGNVAPLYFSSGNLFVVSNVLQNFHGNYTITATTTNTFTVSIAGATLPGSGTGAGFVGSQPNNTSTGWFNQTYANTTFTAPPGRIGVDGTGPVVSNNGLYASGTPDIALIAPDTFSVRWTGQVQPQFTEEYTFVIHADDGATLLINGQPQVLKTVPATNSGGSTYLYDNPTGNTIVNYTGSVVRPGSFVVGETVRLDPTAGNLVHADGSSYTYDSVTGLAVIAYSTTLTTVLPGGFGVGQIVELDPTAGTASALANARYTITAATATTFTVSFGVGAFASQATGATINVTDNRDAVITAVHATGTGTYSYTSGTGDAVVTYTALGIPNNTIAVGNVLALDPSSGNLSGLPNAFATVTAVTATTFTVNYGIGAFANGSIGNITIVAPPSAGVNQAITTAFTVNFEAAKYAHNSTSSINFDIVNKPLKDWASMGNERFARIPLVGGRRYDIQLDYFEGTGFCRCWLFWYSASQPKQVIPAERLYPSSVAQAGSDIVSEETASAIIGDGFSQTLAGSNGGAVSISGQPAWLTLSGGVLSGTPPTGAAGDYQILVTTTNAAGTGTSVLNLHVDQTSANVTREYWNGVAGTSVASIPVSSAPSGTETLTSLQSTPDFGDNYGARLRGYITAPVTGNYYFWLAASNAAELWISNDSEPVNKLRRANVTAGSATPLDWPAAAKSPWLALEAGRRYYFEILHKAGAGAGDNLAVGWLKPGQTGSAPSEVISGAVLSPYFDTPALANPGTLFIATMLSQGGAVTNGVGTSTLRLSADESTATMNYTYSNLTGPITSQHIHTDPYLGHPSTIVFDIDTPETPGDGLQLDGSYKWTITPKGTLSAADIREIIKQGKAYINLHTAAYPSGEIRGNYTLAVGSRTFTPPPAPPSWADDSNTDAGAQRFLTQASYGPNIADLTALKAIVPAGGKTRYEMWIDAQFALSPASTGLQLPEVLAKEFSDAGGGGQFDESLTFNAWWRNSLSGPDQLRQRVAFALSQIHVVSAQGPLDNRAEALSYFYDKLATNAFGNFRDILEDTTLTPAMGRYLDMLRNDKPDLTIGRIPNENYAREIKQLFAVGLYRLWPDGTLMLNSKDAPIDTYTQREIVGYAHVFTGWDYGYDGAMHSSFTSPANWMRQMRETPGRHFTGPKRILNNEVLPGLATLGGQPLDPYATHNSTHFGDPAYQALSSQELDAAHDQLFNHPNVGPFICRQLIQRMVTSNPSRDYLYRVVQKFNDNGSGTRGDMQAVVKAILLDFEARSGTEATKPAYGKQREPVLRVAAAARAFRLNSASGTYSQTDSHIINVAMPNRLAAGNNVFLEFPRPGAWTPGDPTPTSESYTVLNSPAPTTTTFSVNAKGWTGVDNNGLTNGGVTGTYTQAAGSNSITISISSHWLGVNQKCYLDFTAATGGTALTDGIYTAATSTSTGSGDTAGTTFTITGPDTTARTGRVRMVRYQGSYTVENSGLPAPQERRITFDTTFGGIADHHLIAGNSIYLNYTLGNPLPLDGEFVIDTVPDANTFTILTTAANANNGFDANNGMWMFPLVSLPLTRNGAVGAPPSTFLMGRTTDDFDQSPLDSPTVFNFFLPDYKYAGTLASQGITTPEFQITAETTVIRQANFLYNGVFNPGNTNGISSFISGGNALVMDFGTWMSPTLPIATDGLGAPTDTAQPWTHNQNIVALIDHLSTLLTAGQLSANAKTIIRNFVSTPISAISQASPCVFTTSVPHNLVAGDLVLVSGVTVGTFNFSVGNNATARAVASAPTATTFTLTGQNCTSNSGIGLTAAHVSLVPYNNGTTTPTDTHKRDRLRAIIHLILTSPDYTIQR